MKILQILTLHLFCYKNYLNNKFNDLLSTQISCDKRAYDNNHQSQFYISVSLAILGIIITVIGLFTGVITTQIATYLFIPTAIASLVHGQLQIASGHSEKSPISERWTMFNVGFLILIAASSLLSVMIFKTLLMPLSFIVSLIHCSISP